MGNTQKIPRNSLFEHYTLRPGWAEDCTPEETEAWVAELEATEALLPKLVPRATSRAYDCTRAENAELLAAIEAEEEARGIDTRPPTVIIEWACTYRKRESL